MMENKTTEPEVWIDGNLKKLSEVTKDELIKTLSERNERLRLITEERDYLRKLCMVQASSDTAQVQELINGRAW